MGPAVDSAYPGSPGIFGKSARRSASVAGLLEHRNRHAAATLLQCDQIASGQLQLARSGRTDERDIIPGELGHRLRELLQPAVVGETAVVDREVRTEDQLQTALGRRGRGELRRRLTRSRRQHLDVALRRAARGQESIVQGAAPGRFEVGAQARLPCLADEIVRRDVQTTRQGQQHFVHRARVVKRFDERLHDAQRAVEGAGVAPALQEMRFRDVPLAQLGGLVGVQAEVHAPLHAAQHRPEVQVGGCVVDRVATQNHGITAGDAANRVGAIHEQDWAAVKAIVSR